MREQAVRAHRQTLLQQVLAAGHAVDTTVTADTRRIIRVPGSLHGRTKWACTVLPEGQIHRPLRTWIMDLPKAGQRPSSTEAPPT
jgi:DNA primase catalytic subunit